MSTEQKVTKVVTSEPTAQEFLDSLKGANGQMDILNEALGFESTETQVAEPVIQKDEKVAEPVATEPAKKEVKEPKKDATADALSNAIGIQRKVEVSEDITQKDKLAKYEEIARRNAELERTVAINEETESLKELLLTMPEDEAPIVVAEVEKLIASPAYLKMSGMSAKEKAGKLIAEARGLAIDAILNVREARLNENAEASKTLKKIITAPDAQPSGGSDGQTNIDKLRQNASTGDKDAQEDFIYEVVPGAKDYVDKILKSMG